MNIADHIASMREQIAPFDCQLVAVSKTKPMPVLLEAYAAGIRNFGENKVQEITEKYEQMPKDVRWHMIGHLQSNKVKYIAPFVHLIHSVDSLKLLKEINKQAVKANRQINCLLQMHIAEEESKFGLSKEELFELLHSETLKNSDHVAINGLMGMATFTEHQEQVRKEFRQLKHIFDQVKTSPDLPPQVQMQTLSMGMSGDYPIALEEGSNMIRIGTTIFGSRN